MGRKDSGWWDDFFPAFRPIFGRMSAADTNKQLKFLTEKMNLKPGMSLLDCPCGIGRFSIPLAKTGVKVTGVDITESYLAELEEKSARRRLNIKLFENDMRRIDFKNEFDAGANLWTSFGYFDKESDNFLVLRKMYAALKPGGRFVLHVINRDWIIRYYTPTGWFEMNGIKVLESREMDYAHSINRGKWIFIKDGQEQTYEANIRMYSYHEVIMLFEKAGFEQIEGYADESGGEISSRNRMMYIFGRKPLNAKN